MAIEAVDPAGEVFDRFAIRRAAPRELSLASSWHTPEPAPPVPANDDGNRAGERFDFHGTTAGSVAGMAANLGRLWVNEDREAIHVGLSEVMLWPGQTLLLMVGSPRSQGVTNVARAGSLRDHPLAALQVGVSHRGVEIESHLFKFLEGFQVERSVVDQLSSPHSRGSLEWRHIPYRLHGRIRRKTEAIAHRQRWQER